MAAPVLVGAWFACAEPERPTDPMVRWHADCAGCLARAAALAWSYPDDSHVQHLHTRLATT